MRSRNMFKGLPQYSRSYKWGETALVAPPELLACVAGLVEAAMWDETSGIANNEVTLEPLASPLGLV